MLVCRGEALDKLGRRDEAATAYESALFAFEKDLERSPDVQNIGVARSKH